MNPKIRTAALVGALLAVTATAWATNDYRPTLVPAYDVGTTQAPTPAPARPILVQDTLAPGETLLNTQEAAPAPDPVPTRVEHANVQQPRITVEKRRLSVDERIQLAVMDRIAANPRLSGKISVQSNDRVVRLSGWTRTSGQAWQAERDAHRVPGVRYIQNEIRPRVGGSV